LSAKVFISYRRADDPWIAQLLKQKLGARIPASDIFIDVTSIGVGQAWLDAIDQAIGASTIVMAIIGPNWSGRLREHARGDASRDMVRYEISSALRRNIPVIPILIGEALLPTSEELPSDVSGILKYNSIRLRPETFDSDATLLADALSKLSPAKQPPQFSQSSEKIDLADFYSKLSGMVSVDALAIRRTDSWTAMIGKGGVWLFFYPFLAPYFAIRKYGFWRFALYATIFIVVVGVIGSLQKK